METNPQEAERAFKDAHLFLKRMIVEVAGEQQPNTHWLLQPEQLEKIPEMYWPQIYHKLKLLVIAYDNMTAEQVRCPS